MENEDLNAEKLVKELVSSNSGERSDDEMNCTRKTSRKSKMLMLPQRFYMSYRP